MKKIILFFVCVGWIAPCVSAETMEFLTILSNPVGVFRHVNVQNNATMYQLNFCNAATSFSASLQANGVTVTGNLTAKDLSCNAAATFNINTLAVGSGAQFEAGNLSYGSGALYLSRSGQKLLMAVKENNSQLIYGNSYLYVNMADIGTVYYRDSLSSTRQITAGDASKASGAADWKSVGTESSCITKMKNKGYSAAAAQTNCKAALLRAAAK